MRFGWKKFLVFAVPMLIFLGQILVEIFVPQSEKPAFHSEGGPHEMVEASFLIAALPIAIYLCFKVKDKWLKLWAGVAALCCFYVAGEELSWGQWIFHWATPEEWARLNDQNETNLHNTSAWLDQKPRAVLELGVLIGGLIIPAVRRWAPRKLPEKFRDIYPGNEVVMTAFFALAVKIIDAVEWNGRHAFWRGSEVMELYLYYFVLIYLVYLAARWKAERKI